MELIQKFLSMSQNSVQLAKRMLARSVFLFALTVAGFYGLDLIMDTGIGQRFGLADRFPEFISMMRAAAIFTFIEMSLFWIRFGTQPKIDVQETAVKACETATGAAVVHVSNTLLFLARLVVFLYLMQ